MKQLLTLLLSSVIISAQADSSLIAGNLINQQNVEKFTPYLDKPIVDLITQGTFSITIGKQFDMSPNPSND